MAGVLDAQVHVATETTYGTFVTPTRSFEPYADNARQVVSFLESSGMRAQMETIRSDRRRAVNMGGTDSIEVDVLDKGAGMLFQAMLADSTVNQVDTGAAYLQSHSSTHEASATSLTVQWGKPPISGAVLPFSFVGGTVTSWTLAQDLNALLKLTVDLDYQDVTTGQALASAAYPASTRPFGWDDVTILLADATIAPTNFSLTYDAMVDVDRRFLRGSVLKKQPLRNGIPAITGELGVEFESTAQFNNFITGATQKLVATWNRASAIGTYASFLKVTLAKIQYDGDATPVVSLSDLPRQPLPFKVLDDGTSAAVNIQYQATDTAY